MAELYLALVHYPVLDKDGRTVTSSVTTLDVHDLGRTACTYGLAGYYIITPLESMRYLVQRMIGFWEAGAGKTWKPTRHQALQLARLTRTLEECLEDITRQRGAAPRVIGTSARPSPDAVTFEEVSAWLGDPGPPVVLLLGTGYGLAPEAMALASHRLPPVRAAGAYNHLTVRSAAAIMVDRLIGEDIEKPVASQAISHETTKGKRGIQKHASGHTQT